MNKIIRRQFFVKKEFQGKFIFLYAVTIILISFMTTYALDSRLNEAVDELFFSSHLKVQNTAEFVHSELLQINALAVLLLVAAVIAMSLTIFRRLNAHFRRIEQVFERMALGRYDSEPLPASRFNEISSFIGLVEQVRETWSVRSARLEEIVAQLRQALEASPGSAEIEELNRQLQSLLDGIKLSEGDIGEG